MVALNELDIDNATSDASGEELGTAYEVDNERKVSTTDVFDDGVE
jgi:hypothetical protein